MSPRSRGAVVDGVPARQHALARVRRRARRLTVTRREQDEAELERRLISHPGVTRANTVAVMSPAGGVGKTTCAFVLGNLLATHLKLRTIAVDAGNGFGSLAQLADDAGNGFGTLAQLADDAGNGFSTLAHLVPPHRRAERGSHQLLADAGRLFTAAELGPYVSRLPTGLHVLAARHDRRLTPGQLGELLALLSCFYEAILLDLGAGVVGPLASLAAARADQIVLVTTPDSMTSSAMLHARAHLRRPDRTVVAINRAHPHARGDERPYTAVALPQDQQLVAMLESGTYSLGPLKAGTRRAIKALGLAVADQLA